MSNPLSAEQVQQFKARGFLRNRGTDCFSGRIVSAGGVYTPEQLEIIAECARRYGNGKIAFTARQTAEVVGIPAGKIDAACQFLQEKDPRIRFGGTGAKIRPITACKGTTCVFGCCDTQGIARALHEKYYLGMAGVTLPHKFKIAVGGCPNSCIKPSLNDFGVEARRTKDGVRFQLYVGGTWGKQTRAGNPLSRMVEEEEIQGILDGVLDWFQTNAAPKERLGAAIDRLGIEHLEEALTGK